MRVPSPITFSKKLKARTRPLLETLKTSFSFFLSNQTEWFTFQYESDCLKRKKFPLKNQLQSSFFLPALQFVQNEEGPGARVGGPEVHVGAASEEGWHLRLSQC